MSNQFVKKPKIILHVSKLNFGYYQSENAIFCAKI